MAELKRPRVVSTEMGRFRCVASFGLGFLALVVGGCESTTSMGSTSSQLEPATAVIGGPQTGMTAQVRVVSDPRDAMVVINRRPVGLTPRTIELPVTNQGYLAEQVTVAVRFVARDVEEASLTSSVTLYPTDRAPAQLDFAREQPVKRSFD